MTGRPSIALPGGARVTGAHGYRYEEFGASIEGIEEYRTPGGRSPIRPSVVRVTFSLEVLGRLRGEVVGERLDDDDKSRRNLVRRFDSETIFAQPDWLRALVFAVRPGDWARWEHP